MYALNKISEKANHTGPVYAVCRGPEANTFYSASSDGYAALWKGPGLEQLHEAVNAGAPVFAVRYLPAYNWLLAGTASGSLHGVDRNTRTERFNKYVHPGGVFDLLLLGPLQMLLVAGADGSVSIWELPAMKLIIQLPLCEGKIRRLMALPDSGEFAAACGDGTVRIIETSFFNETARLVCGKEGVTSLALHPSKPVLMAGDKTAHVHLFELSGHTRLLSIPAHNFSVYDIQFHPTQPVFATASRDKTLKLWNSQTLEVFQRIGSREGGHTHSVNRLLWLNDTTLITAGDDRRIISWQLSSGVE
jgi:WD40 repeat protein